MSSSTSLQNFKSLSYQGVEQWPWEISQNPSEGYCCLGFTVKSDFLKLSPPFSCAECFCASHHMLTCGVRVKIDKFHMHGHFGVTLCGQNAHLSDRNPPFWGVLRDFVRRFQGACTLACAVKHPGNCVAVVGNRLKIILLPITWLKVRQVLDSTASKFVL